jgi:hypothetical protein
MTVRPTASHAVGCAPSGVASSAVRARGRRALAADDAGLVPGPRAPLVQLARPEPRAAAAAGAGAAEGDAGAAARAHLTGGADRLAAA